MNLPSVWEPDEMIFAINVNAGTKTLRKLTFLTLEAFDTLGPPRTNSAILRMLKKLSKFLKKCSFAEVNAKLWTKNWQTYICTEIVLCTLCIIIVH